MDVNWLPEGEESRFLKGQVVVFRREKLRAAKLLKAPVNEPGHKVSWSVSRLDRSLLQSCEHHDDF